MTVVAEGVEDEATWDLLAALQCDLVQGYVMTRPLPGPLFEQWLRAWEGTPDDAAPPPAAYRAAATTTGGPLVAQVPTPHPPGRGRPARHNGARADARVPALVGTVAGPRREGADEVTETRRGARPC